ncbi:MAG: hypothetical protein LBH06_07460 [Rikenellaceae bacterium]|jgi:hypothetical protein|nr:hypothetical protein [Rikenellaceae bacterium]
MKKSQLYDEAERLYAEEQWTFDAIARKLECSDRTLRGWAKEGRWDVKRSEFINLRQGLPADVQDIAMLLARKIKTQLSKDMEPSPHTLNAFTRIAASLLKVREYEKAMECEGEGEHEQRSDNVRAAAAAKFKEVFGVDLEI